jgi:hypothetical protein
MKGLDIFKNAMFPYRILIIPIAILGLFAPLSYKLQYMGLLQFCLTEITPFCLLYLSLRNERDLDRCLKAFVFSYIVIGIYGIITYMIGTNPIFLYCSMIYTPDAQVFVEADDAVMGALNGRATGNVGGALPWGQSSLVACLFLALLPKEKKNIWTRLAVLIAILNCIFCTKRSILAPILLLVAYVIVRFIMYVRKRYLLGAIFIIVVGCVTLFSNKYMNAFFEQNVKTSLMFWDDKVAQKNDIRGSSNEMRYTQFLYLHKLLGLNYLQGNGYNYNSWYTSIYQNSTPICAFESIYFQVVANSGYIGLAFWIVFFIGCYKMTKSYNAYKYDNAIFYICYLFSLVLTGIQSSFYYYMIAIAFYVRMKEFKYGGLVYMSHKKYVLAKRTVIPVKNDSTNVSL